MGKNAKLRKQRKAAKSKQKNGARNLSQNQVRPVINLNRKLEQVSPHPSLSSTPNFQNQDRPPIPEPELIKYWLSHPDTLNWVLSQWHLLFGFEQSVSDDDASSLATTMLKSLTAQTILDLNHDSRVLYSNNPFFEMNIGLNVWNWTLWTSIEDKLTRFAILSQDRDDFELKQLSMTL